MTGQDWIPAEQAHPRDSAQWLFRRKSGMSITAPVHRGVFEVTGLYTFCGRTLKPRSRFEARPYRDKVAPPRACERCWPNGR